MKETEKSLAALGIKVPDLLLPGPGADLKKWAVIACDQHTQDRGYWEQAAAIAGDAPSALKCILPEAFLDDNREKRIRAIHAEMKRLLDTDFFTPRRGFVYIERDTPFHKNRRGLLACLDLEQYDWKMSGAAGPGAKTLVRPTEGTIAERLPVRMDVRRGAALDMPHILILIDDKDDALLPALGREAKKNAPLYDTELMLNGGAVRGWLLDSGDGGGAAQKAAEMLAEGLEKLAASAPRVSGSPFLYAAGDGNHSLAAAKNVWDEYKQAHPGDPGLMDHPARHILVEIENLYDPALAVEPIHRFVFGAAPGEIAALFPHGARSGGCIAVPDGPDIVQPLLDDFVKTHEGVKIDYIHGAEELKQLAARSKGAGLLLPPFDRSSLFRIAAERGVLPRKSFSLGEACEKRYYLECRRLFANGCL